MVFSMCCSLYAVLEAVANWCSFPILIPIHLVGALMKTKISSIVVLAAILSGSITSLSGSLGNRMTGSFVHSIRRLFNKNADARLKPEHEKEIRSLAEKMGIGQELNIHGVIQSFQKIGPCGFGNRLYFDDAWFDEWADAPHVKQYVIGHLLARVSLDHTPDFWTVAGIPTALGTYATYFLARYCIDDIFNGIVKSRYIRNLSGTKGIIAVGASCFVAILCMFTPIAGSFLLCREIDKGMESTADSYVLEKLGPIFGEEVLAQGAGEYWAHVSSSELYRLDACFTDLKDRLKRLKMPTIVSKKSVKQMLKGLKKRIIKRLIHLYEDNCFEDEFARYKEVPFWKDSGPFASLQSFCSTLIESIKSGSFNKAAFEEECASEDLNRLEELVLGNQIDASRLEVVEREVRREVGTLTTLFDFQEN